MSFELFLIVTIIMNFIILGMLKRLTYNTLMVDDHPSIIWIYKIYFWWTNITTCGIIIYFIIKFVLYRDRG